MKNAFAFMDFVASIGEKNERRLTDLALQHPYEDSFYKGNVVWGLYGPGERIEKEAFGGFVPISFGGQSFNSVSCWDSYLTGIYGDYMQLPPEEDRHPHDVDVFCSLRAAGQGARGESPQESE